MKLTIIGQAKCAPCQIIKNQVLDRIDELTAIGARFEYINLDILEDKDTFIHAHKLSSTPTIWISKDGETVKELTGFINVDTLFEMMEGLK